MPESIAGPSLIAPIGKNLIYDYIIVGAGCAGLSLLMRLLASPKLAHRKILLTDRAAKTVNDRTWCFWAKPAGFRSAGSPSAFFDDIVYKEWKQLWLRHPSGDISLDMAPYTYKMIRGQDFYQYCFSKIRESTNVHWLLGEAEDIDSARGTITINGQVCTASYIFSSVLLEPPVLQPNQYYLLQHFKGWWIETETDYFDPQQADLMNFKTSQQHGCTFLYMLPVSTRKALIEYTLFTEDELEPGEYDKGLEDFIRHELGLNAYKITEVEKGIIPMTNLMFPLRQGKLYYIGTAGGQTKASTGYTFQFIQKHSQALVKHLEENGEPLELNYPGRFRLYDSVLLRILHEGRLPGAEIFHRMFQKNKASMVMRFLDNESSFWEELRIMNSSNKSFFLPAAMAEIFSL